MNSPRPMPLPVIAHSYGNEVSVRIREAFPDAVLRVLPEGNRLVVEGVNIIKRHTKPNPQKNIKGGIVEREASMHASNVQLVCPECNKMTRLGKKVLTDGRKVRICRKCEGVVDK